MLENLFTSIFLLCISIRIWYHFYHSPQKRIDKELDAIKDEMDQILNLWENRKEV